MSVSSDSLASANRPSSGRDRLLIGVLQADWRNMLNHHESKDVKILTGPNNEELFVHNLVLIARCGGRLTEKLSTAENTLVYKHLEYDAVKKIVLYLYSAELEVTSAMEIVSLQLVAYEFGLQNLRSYFVQCLDYLLTQSNVCKVLSKAHSFFTNQQFEQEIQQDLWTMVDCALQFIMKNIKSIISSDTIIDLDKDSLKLLVSSKLPISNQEILKLVLKWGRLKAGIGKIIQSNWTEEERKIIRGHTEDVLPHIQLTDGRSLSPDSISDGVYGILERYSWVESTSLSSEEKFSESIIIGERQVLATPLSEWCGHGGHWLLLYRGSTHGFSAKDFHSHVDNNGPTLTVILSASGHIFGGFTDISWHSSNRRGKYSSSQYSFLFSLYNPSLSNGLAKYTIRQHSYAINSHPNYGPIFGSGADLSISNNCNINEDSYTRMPASYGDDHTQPLSLCGTVYFKVKDYEVFGQQS